MHAKLSWLNCVGAPLVVLDPAGQTALAMNRAAARVLGRSLRDPVPVADLLPDTLLTAIASAIKAGIGQTQEPVTITTGAGPCLIAMLEPPGGPGWLVTLPDNVPGAADAPGSFRWNPAWKAILDELPVAVEIYDAELREVFASRQAAQTVGYAAGELPSLHDWWDRGYPEPAARRAIERAWDEAVATSRATGAAVTIRDLSEIACKGGDSRIMEVRYRAFGDAHLMVYWDVSEDRRTEIELRRLALVDPLTELANRRAFDDGAMQGLAQAATAAAPVSLLLLDLDHFKAINDRYGHDGGDDVLRAFADHCRAMARPDDLVARLGGEEFAILMPGLGAADAYRRAELIRQDVADHPILLRSETVHVTVSIGCATCRPARAESLAALIKAADEALYEAKKRGRNLVFAHPGEGGGPEAAARLRDA